MATYGLGIDTGGTFTDTAIVDLDTGDIVCGNKALTTQRDLSEGIENSLLGLDRTLFDKISLISLSSTLATNSVVENKGCRVGLICIGKSYINRSAPECYYEIGGKFNMNGEEVEGLDIQNAKTALEKMKGRVDALAISGYVSVRNTSHEDRIAELADRILGLPVVCGHELTSKLGFEQRTTTAVMNARLIPTITELLSSVKAVLEHLGLNAPLMVVKGDGALMKEDVARTSPVETILSGPASSLTGAKALTGLGDAMVIDIGGTTSDIGILKNGFPRVDPEGANLGGKRTRVVAADIATFGIGGDSRILVNRKKILLSPVREIPLCIASEKWPGIRNVLKTLEFQSDDRSEEERNIEDILQETEFFTLTHSCDGGDISDIDREFLALVEKQPMRLSDAGALLCVPPHSINVSLLECRGYITRIGVTPTDLLHAEGSYVGYDARASAVAIGYLARKSGLKAQEFIDVAKKMIVKKIASCAIEKLFHDESGNDQLSISQKEIVEKIISDVPEDYVLDFRLKYPIIGIGAPVGSWLPEVADILHTELVIPKRSEIGNAIGAITGSVSETATVVVRASGPEYEEEPECDVFTGSEIRTFCRPREALDHAKRAAEKMALAACNRSGSKDPVIECSVEESYVEISPEKRFFRGATVTVRATGKPDLK